MNKYAVFECDSYDNIYSAVIKHFETHNIKNELTPDMHVVIKANLVTDKNPIFAATNRLRNDTILMDGKKRQW